MRGVKTRESGKWKKLALFLVLLIIFGVLLNSVRKVYEKKKSAEKALVRMNNEFKQLNERGQFLENSIQRLETTEGLEFEIRKKLNVARVGEGVAVIVDEIEAPPVKPLNSSPWQKLKDFFAEMF